MRFNSGINCRILKVNESFVDELRPGNQAAYVVSPVLPLSISVTLG